MEGGGHFLRVMERGGSGDVLKILLLVNTSCPVCALGSGAFSFYSFLSLTPMKKGRSLPSVKLNEGQ